VTSFLCEGGSNVVLSVSVFVIAVEADYGNGPHGSPLRSDPFAATTVMTPASMLKKPHIAFFPVIINRRALIECSVNLDRKIH
jgi:hypothetical protein